jgi:hypothetical protein
MKRRHLSPYAENPFTALELGRLPIEHCRKIILPTSDQQMALLRACDDWQFPIFLTLILTGLRPGELCHLLLPEDLDFQRNLLFVRNRVKLGWQVKSRNERMIPLEPVSKHRVQCTDWQGSCIEVGLKGDPNHAIDVRVVAVDTTVRHGVQDGAANGTH